MSVGEETILLLTKLVKIYYEYMMRPCTILLWLLVFVSDHGTFHHVLGEIVRSENGFVLFDIAVPAFRGCGIQSGSYGNKTLMMMSEQEHATFCDHPDVLPDRFQGVENLALIMNYSQTCDGVLGNRLEMHFPGRWCDVLDIILLPAVDFPGLWSNMRPSGEEYNRWLQGEYRECMFLEVDIEASFDLYGWMGNMTVDVIIDDDLTNFFDHWFVQVWFRGFAPLLYLVLAFKASYYFWVRYRDRNLNVYQGLVLSINVVSMVLLALVGTTFGGNFFTDNVNAVLQTLTYGTFFGMRSSGDFCLAILYSNVMAQFLRQKRRQFFITLLGLGALCLIMLDLVPFIAFLVIDDIQLLFPFSSAMIIIFQVGFLGFILHSNLKVRKVLQKLVPMEENQNQQQGNNANAVIRLLFMRLRKCVRLSMACSGINIVLLALHGGRISTQRPWAYAILFMGATLTSAGNSIAQIEACVPSLKKSSGKYTRKKKPIAVLETLPSTKVM